MARRKANETPMDMNTGSYAYAFKVGFGAGYYTSSSQVRFYADDDDQAQQKAEDYARRQTHGGHKGYVLTKPWAIGTE